MVNILEDQLAIIIAKLESVSNKKKKEKLYYAEQNGKREELERKAKELEIQKEKEIQDLKNLLLEVERWQQAKMLREYLNALEEKANKEMNLTEELKTWLCWARQKADWHDPLINSIGIIRKTSGNHVTDHPRSI